jgi:uncharacterized membrane protein YcaP (DUF421 family)
MATRVDMTQARESDNPTRAPCPPPLALDEVIALLRVETPVWQIVLRGSAIYWLLLLLFRFVVRRDVGAVGIADLLVLVLVADAAQNAMAGDYRTVGDGALLILTLIGWNFAVDWLAFRIPRFRRFASPRPLPLVRDGRLLQRNLARELVSEDELLGKLREHGCDDISQVKAATLEADGEVSVILKRAKPARHDPRRKHAVG